MNFYMWLTMRLIDLAVIVGAVYLAQARRDDKKRQRIIKTFNGKKNLPKSTQLRIDRIVDTILSRNFFIGAIFLAIASAIKLLAIPMYYLHIHAYGVVYNLYGIIGFVGLVLILAARFNSNSKMPQDPQDPDSWKLPS